jgi:hypothetical protein
VVCSESAPSCSSRLPVPEYLWIERLDRDWYLVVQRRLPGRPAPTPNGTLLRELLSLVELQTDAGIEPGRRDMAGYHSLVPSERRRAGALRRRPFFVFAVSSPSGSLRSRERDVWGREAGEGKRVREAV